jgi:hypothetical protein
VISVRLLGSLGYCVVLWISSYSITLATTAGGLHKKKDTRVGSAAF